METRSSPQVESHGLTSWLAKAAPHPDTAATAWTLNPALPRRLRTGVTFDVVLAERPLVEAAYRILERYEQPLGPALVFPPLRLGVILVPCGTSTRWSELVSTPEWGPHTRRPACLGRNHMIQVPASAPTATSTSRWLQPPDDDLTPGLAPFLTAPVQLVRCLAEASRLVRPQSDRPAPASSLRKKAAVVARTVLLTPRRT
ncbi:hypothetical protein ACMATS_25240 [Streptoverticillium reticulum]|uniref:hypothetical protein n=1 Tax=Streptoverticillium reticulum TaxID=1433415 RepID=UPI0039BF14EC